MRGVGGFHSATKTIKGGVQLVAFLVLLASLAGGCVFYGVPPQPSTYPGWCYSLLASDIPLTDSPGQLGLFIEYGTVTPEGTFQSSDGLLQMVYTHNQLVEVEYVAAEIDITNELDDPANGWIYTFPNGMAVSGGINIFGFQETFNETVWGYANNFVVSAYNNPVDGVLASTQAIISLATPPEGVIEIKRLMLFGESNTNGQVVSPFDRDDCVEPTPTTSPTPDPTNGFTSTPPPTPTDPVTGVPPTSTATPTELPSWCYRFDFRVDSFGWVAVDGSATYQSGLGWNTVGDGYLDSAFIGLSFDNTTINGVTMIVSETLYSGGQFYVGSSPNNHEYTISPQSTQWDLRNIDMQTGYLGVGLDSQIGSILDWYGYLTLVELYGSGLNPFGMDNCSPFTPTPTPTGTQYPTITPSRTPTSVFTPTTTYTPSPSPTLDCARFWWSCYTPSPDQTIAYTPTRYPTQTPYPTRTPYTALPTYTPLATYTSIFDGGIYQATQNAQSTSIPATGTASAITNATAQARQGNEDTFIQSQNWWTGGGNWTGRFNNVMRSFGSSMDDSMAWVHYGSDTANGVVTAWNSATPTPINGLPRCKSNPRGHQLCAVYYILENTLFEGAGGIAILVALQTLIYIAIVMKIASFVGTVIDFIRGITKIGG